MAVVFEDVLVKELNEDTDELIEKFPNHTIRIQVIDESDNLLIRCKSAVTGVGVGNNTGVDTNAINSLYDIEVYKESDTAVFGRHGFAITEKDRTFVLEFGRRKQQSQARDSDLQVFNKLITDFKYGRKESVFSQRTDESSASQYFQFYGYLSQQQNMMQDFIRTSTYQRAILANIEDFKDKVVLDVGAGSGILSFFAAQAGARKVYAVEASSMAKHAETLVYANKLSDRIQVIAGKIEEITLGEQVDIIISEPMGYMLFNERMLETYLHAKKWLAPNGKMFPSRGDLHIAPFSDSQLYVEQLTKANFWFQQNFHGVDLSSLRSAALKEYFYQPVVDTFDVRICTAKSFRYSVDFTKADEQDLHRIDIPFSFSMLQTDEVHGLAFWFDVAFFGSQQTVWLSTAPTQPLTHWYQVRCLVDTPLFVQKGQTLSGRVVLVSNKRQSYNVDIELCVENYGRIDKATNSLDLKNPYFRYTGQPPQPPPGCNDQSPSEQYWQTLDASTNQSATNQNGMVVMNGIGNGVTGGNHSSVIEINSMQIQAPNNGYAGHHHQQQHHQQHNHSQQPMITGNMMPLSAAASAPQSQLIQNLCSLPVSPNAASHQSRNSPLSHHHRQVVVQPVAAQVPTSSIGGGISPSLFSSSANTVQQQSSVGVSVFNAGANNSFPVNTSLMIGDYAVASPQNLILPPQQQQHQSSSTTVVSPHNVYKSVHH
ncbi:histone-arginine methyltransferase CARMER-like [Oppia nitens]|uniref:histone-arginine methyltransferase CARMER-like n=1 Tax=Oppia nitens TaxID=1686743 RepID=UPI0023DC65B8|nr:histone-arginine methyltransferase CARMER-like [Oppia nitens]